MSLIEVEQLLAPVSDESPCGIDLSDLTEYYVLEEAVRGKEETQFSEAEPPEWSKVLELATTLSKQGKDLWVMIYLVHASLELDAFQGLRDGLKLLAGNLSSYWDDLFPLLDDEDDDPALQRINILNYLSPENAVFSTTLKNVPLCQSRQLGSFSYHHLQLLSDEVMPKDGEEVPARNLIAGAFKDSDSEIIEEQSAFLKDIIAFCDEIDEFVFEKISSNTKLKELGDFCRKIQSRRAEFIGMADETADLSVGDIGETVKTTRKPTATGEIQNHQDIIKLLDKICQWYEKNEPSSPVPLMLRRAKGLVGCDFREIVANIATNAESQINELFGPADV